MPTPHSSDKETVDLGAVRVSLSARLNSPTRATLNVEITAKEPAIMARDTDMGDIKLPSTADKMLDLIKQSLQDADMGVPSLAHSADLSQPRTKPASSFIVTEDRYGATGDDFSTATIVGEAAAMLKMLAAKHPKASAGELTAAIEGLMERHEREGGKLTELLYTPHTSNAQDFARADMHEKVVSMLPDKHFKPAAREAAASAIAEGMLGDKPWDDRAAEAQIAKILGDNAVKAADLATAQEKRVAPSENVVAYFAKEIAEALVPNRSQSSYLS